ncbi:MAG: 3-isopropylmalate dehydratase small subunit [Chloroflexi bacterium]|nr:3-isopropylmalate dehydratase small subunit [Chloroflexota bacterium]
MHPFTCHTGLAVPLDRVNVDTDQIIPKQFLKRIERTGFGDVLFFDWRYGPDGQPDPGFDLSAPRYVGASILVTGRNFGCGSSREHAVWALHDYGIRSILAPSFADIFYNNCLSNGLLPIPLPDAQIETLLDRARTLDGYRLTVDLECCTVSDEHGFQTGFEIDPFIRFRLLNGLDDIGLTLQHADAILAYERRIEGIPA